MKVERTIRGGEAKFVAEEEVAAPPDSIKGWNNQKRSKWHFDNAKYTKYILIPYV